MDFDPPDSPRAVSRDDRDLDATSRGWPPARDPALAALDEERRRIDAIPLPIYQEVIDRMSIDPGEPTPEPRTFEHDDGSLYARVPSDEMLDDGDRLDSRDIVDDGAPA